MSEIKIQIPVSITEETHQEIKSLLTYSSVRMQHSRYDLPRTEEDVIKAAIYFYFEYIEGLKKSTVKTSSPVVLKLMQPGQLKNRIKEFVKDRKLKQTELAKLTQIDDGNISIILSNRSQPSMDYFLRIWVALDCPPIEELFYREEK